MAKGAEMGMTRGDGSAFAPVLVEAATQEGRREPASACSLGATR